MTFELEWRKVIVFLRQILFKINIESVQILMDQISFHKHFLRYLLIYFSKLNFRIKFSTLNDLLMTFLAILK